MNSQWVDVELEESIPPNVIRIETEDGSEEYIEIILPTQTQDNNTQEEQGFWSKVVDTAQTVGLVAIDTLDTIGNIPTPYTKPAKIPKLILVGYKSARKLLKFDSLELQEILTKVDRLKKVTNKDGDDTGIRLVKNKKELDKIWREISQNERGVKPDTDNKGNPMKYIVLDDKQTRIQYRTHSSDASNNLPTIDIHNKELKAKRKIHIDIHQKKGGT